LYIAGGLLEGFHSFNSLLELLDRLMISETLGFPEPAALVPLR
jgi:hypothetical protein